MTPTARYDFRTLEAAWQRLWDERQVFRALPDDRPKFYCLEMLPYPSGRIHMGHVRNYAIGDAVARYKRMCGYNVLHPMGWDAFGLPAENAAIANNMDPGEWTWSNIANMKAQLRKLGFSYDWERELATCSAEYAAFEQQLFLEMFDRGLVYRRKGEVNWCNQCKTVLANEQVEDGCCWRDGSEVERRELDQWFFRITDYAEELLAGLERLSEGWPEAVLSMQRNWIGRSEGAHLVFDLPDIDEQIEVFTTRPDTLFGATFMSLAPEHPLALRLCAGRPEEAEVRAFIERVRRQDKITRTNDREKEGVFTGAYARNPVNGQMIPVYLGNFVLMDYGTGAIMAVPGHDQRDYDFARKYELPIIEVVRSEQGIAEAAWTGPGELMNSGAYDGMPSEEARGAIVRDLEAQGRARSRVQYRLKDWGISRQRYWGNPIPVINCEHCGAVPVPREDLPVLLPQGVQLQGSGELSPLATVSEFVNVDCPACGRAARRETDTMDTFVQSSWYFHRYACQENKQQPLDPEALNYWMDVDQYIGGIEHAVMHLLYARFFHKVLRDLGYVRTDEPFTRLLTQGMVLLGGRKMSKSLGNIVDPDALIERFGADTVRLFTLFAAPPEKDLEWNDAGVEGAHRFLNRLWRLVMDAGATDWSAASGEQIEPGTPAAALRQKLHASIRRISQSMEGSYHFNTGIAAAMELVNEISALEDRAPASLAMRNQALRSLVVLLSPIVPHISEELWSRMGADGLACEQPWPTYDPDLARADHIVLVVQVNGKVRARIETDAGQSREDLEALAREHPKIAEMLTGIELKKVIVVPDKLVNFAGKPRA